MVFLCGFELHLLDDGAPFAKVPLATSVRNGSGGGSDQKGGDRARCPDAEDVMWAPAVALPHRAGEKDVQASPSGVDSCSEYVDARASCGCRVGPMQMAVSDRE